MQRLIVNLASLTTLTLVVLCASLAFAHQTKTVGSGNGEYQVIVGLLNNPAYSGQLNGIDLIIQDMNDQPVENLEESLEVEVITPDGTARMPLTLRAQSDEPGSYTGNFIPAEPGNYTFEVRGFIGEVEFEEVFNEPAHSEPFVLDASEITLP